MNVISEGNGTTVRVRLIFDLGSQKSYITENVRQELKIAATKSQSLFIKTFGNKTDKET